MDLIALTQNPEDEVEGGAAAREGAAAFATSATSRSTTKINRREAKKIKLEYKISLWHLY